MPEKDKGVVTDNISDTYPGCNDRTLDALPKEGFLVVVQVMEVPDWGIDK